MSYIKKKSQRQEKRTAREFKGRTTPASGALSGIKGDVRTDKFLIENKFTDSDSYTLKFVTWNKIRMEALKDELRTPLMQVDIQDLQLVILNKSLFNSIYQRKEEPVVTKTVLAEKSIKLTKKALLEVFELQKSYSIIPYYTIEFTSAIKSTFLVVMPKNEFFNLMEL